MSGGRRRRNICALSALCFNRRVNRSIYRRRSGLAWGNELVCLQCSLWMGIYAFHHQNRRQSHTICRCCDLSSIVTGEQQRPRVLELYFCKQLNYVVNCFSDKVLQYVVICFSHKVLMQKIIISDLIQTSSLKEQRSMRSIRRKKRQDIPVIKAT
jgi:hypothetical protein